MRIRMAHWGWWYSTVAPVDRTVGPGLMIPHYCDGVLYNVWKRMNGALDPEYAHGPGLGPRGTKVCGFFLFFGGSELIKGLFFCQGGGDIIGCEGL